MTVEFIYGLHSGDGKVFYVGRTNDLAVRLGRHLSEANPNGTPKERHIHAILQRGGTVEMKTLEVGSAESLRGKEDLWIVNLEGAGHVLMNRRGGDDSHKTNFACPAQTPWAAELFETATWKPGILGAKSTEKSAWIKGVAFHRVGKRELRFHHTTYGNWKCGGYLWEDKVNAACRMLTQGTQENRDLLAQVEQVNRLKPPSP